MYGIGWKMTVDEYHDPEGPPEPQRGRQLMLSFWAWGENGREVMTNLDRTFRNVTVALRGVSDEIRHSSPATPSDD